MASLGINLLSFLFQLGNFVLVFALLTWILHKPLLKLLDTRRAEIKQSLENADKLKAELIASEERQKEILEKAQLSASELLRKAKEQADALEDKLNQEAQEKAERMLEKAAIEIAREHEVMKSELKVEVADMVIKATEKVLAQDISTSEKEKSIKKMLGQNDL